MIDIVSIRLKINGQDVDLAVEEARHLYDELNKFFKPPNIYPVYPPAYPAYPEYPWPLPYKITCSSSSCGEDQS